jgi:hypothetical protein
MLFAAPFAARADEPIVPPAHSDLTLSDQIAALKKQLSDVQKTADQALLQANHSYGAGSGAKSPYKIYGYAQFRYEGVGSDSRSRFPIGTNAHSQGPYNGNYGQGASANGFDVRRAQLFFSGNVTPNTKYCLGTVYTGAVTASSSSQVALLDSWAAYTFGDGSCKNPTITAGQFGQVFGYTIGASSSTRYFPERPLAFGVDKTYTLANGSSTTTTPTGLWLSQDYDKGVSVGYGPGKWHGTFALVNGEGRDSENKQDGVDKVGHITYAIDKVTSIGTSYYNGNLPVQSGTSITPKRELYGIDFQYQPPTGAFALAEGLEGTYESRSFFDEALATNDGNFYNQAYAPGNKVQGYYLLSGYTWHGTGAHPFTLAAGYDYLNRSSSGIDSPTVSIASASTYAGGASGSNWVDSDVSMGAMYNLDKMTRLRFWYTLPTNVAHAEGTTDPTKIAEYTMELQVKY